MKRFVEGVDRGQSSLFPERLDDWIGEDNPVRVIDVFVDELDLGRRCAGRTTRSEAGPMIGNKTRRWCRCPIFFALAALAYILGPDGNHAQAGNQLAAANGASAGATVNGLRRAGWTVTEQQGRIERRPGLPPYETRRRDVHVTTFVLEKDGRRKRCTLAYDSQLDSIAEECRDAE